MKQPAMVMEIGPHYLVVVTREGVFRKISKPAKSVRLGQWVDLAAKSRPRWAFYLGAAAFFLVMIASSLLYNIVPGEPAAIVAIDINPSLKILVNRDKTVREVRPLNNDASKLLVNKDLRGKDIYRAVVELTALAAEKGYLQKQKENLVLVAVVGLDKSSKPILLSKLTDSINTELATRSLAGTVKAYEVAPGKEKEASTKGLSVNKILFQEKARAKGMAVSDSDLKKLSVGAILRNNKKKIPSFFEEEEEENEDSKKAESGKTKNRKNDKRRAPEDGKSNGRSINAESRNPGKAKGDLGAASPEEEDRLDEKKGPLKRGTR